MHVRNATRDDCPALGEIVIGANRSAFEGRVPEACLTELPIEASVANWRRFFDSGRAQQPDVMFLAAEAQPGEVVGFILAGSKTADVIHDVSIAVRYPREITSLSVAPAWHRRGVGRALVSAVATWFVERGERSVAVLAHELNPNRPFYIRLGALELSAQPHDWAGFASRQIVYGWNDIGVVCGAA